jgi:hypothetical protein
MIGRVIDGLVTTDEKARKLMLLMLDKEAWWSRIEMMVAANFKSRFLFYIKEDSKTRRGKTRSAIVVI